MRDWLILYTKRGDRHHYNAKISGATIISAVQNFMEKNVDVDVYSAVEIPMYMDGMGLPTGSDPTKVKDTNTPNGTN